MLVGGQSHAPPPLYLGKRIGSHCAEGWVASDTSYVLVYAASVKELFK